MNISGYYHEIPTDMGAPPNPPVPQHGYGTIDNPDATLQWSRKAKLGTGELGFLIGMGEKTYLLIGGKSIMGYAI